MTDTLVSVLTPSYNYAQFIGDCLTSVENQTHEHIEHIVVDGASTDGTVEVLRDADASVRWVSEPDHGQSHALNKALAMSNGEIIGWLNADDAYADTRAVERAVRVFEAHPEVGVVYGHSLLINSDNRVLQLMWAPPYSAWLLRRMTTFLQPSVFLRRSVLSEPFVNEDLRFVMDRDLWLRLEPKTRFRRVDAVFAVDRQHPGRKVMSDAYFVEHEAYYKASAVKAPPRVVKKVVSTACRLSGLAYVPTLSSRITLAFDLHFDGPVTSIMRQALLPRRLMPGV